MREGTQGRHRVHFVVGKQHRRQVLAYQSGAYTDGLV